MMAQYIEIKATSPDALLFYRMGDFYELFFADAEVASRALGIALTKRGKHLGKDIPMCGVPVHAADDYLQRLIALGHRVAVCEQVEDPAEARKRGAKSVVKRNVVRLVTPGTITEDNLLEPGSANILGALARVRGGTADQYGIAAVDISTGTFTLTSCLEGNLQADITRLAPRELIVADNLLEDEALRPTLEAIDCVVQPQPASMFDSSRAAANLQQFYGVSTMDGFGAFSREELAAANAVIGYIERTQFGERPPLSRPQRDDPSRILYIDAATRANLELVRALGGSREGSLLKAIDRTVSGAGARLLFQRLTSPLTDLAAIVARHDDVSFLLQHEALRTEIREILKALPDMPRAISRLSLNRGGPRDLAAVRAALVVTDQLLRQLGEATSDLPANLAEGLATLEQYPASLGVHLDGLLADEIPLLARDGNFVRSGFDTELDGLRDLSNESRKVIAGLQASYASETGVKNLKIRHNNVLGYFIEVTALNASQLSEDKERFIHRQTMANAMRFTTTELAELESKIASAAGKALQLELGHFANARELVLQNIEALQAISVTSAELDVAASLAQLAEEQGCVRPAMDDGLSFDIVAGRHPVVEQALRKQASNPFVANDCCIGGSEGASLDSAGRIWLLTGPNMGGKSTFLRQNALIVILAQMGSFVPAGSAKIGIVDRLFSRVGAADDLAHGRSTFMVEMVETAAILNQAGSRSLVILDEIGRGTATFDGLSIAWAALEHLHEVNTCRTLFATHYHELTALAAVLQRLSNVTMRVKEWDGDVIFLHEVAQGTADRSYGIQVAKLAGLPETVVHRARSVLEQLESQNRESSAGTLIDDLPLFSAAQQTVTSKPSTTSRLQEELDRIQPDELTPRQALEALYRLKAIE